MPSAMQRKEVSFFPRASQILQGRGQACITGQVLDDTMHNRALNARSLCLWGNQKAWGPCPGRQLPGLEGLMAVCSQNEFSGR